jgi:hypothetical protein
MLGHSAFVLPIGFALYRFGTNATALAADARTLRLMVRATRDAFAALDAHFGDPGEPTVALPSHAYGLRRSLLASGTGKSTRRTVVRCAQPLRSRRDERACSRAPDGPQSGRTADAELRRTGRDWITKASSPSGPKVLAIWLL